MNKVEQAIQRLQQELQRWRGKSLKETPTRTAFIEPLLEALGWDVRDLDEVEPE
jgi:predicted type IV restriction endonuclease